MAVANQAASRVVLFATGAVLVVAFAIISSARTVDTIVIWKVGSAHAGDTPSRVVPRSLQHESMQRGFQLAVEAFPAKGFAARFLDATTRNAAPDILAFNNLGVVKGITTQLGKFEGIGEDARIRRDLIAVTGAFDDLLGPERGWTYLIASSQNHRQARTLALRPPTCSTGAPQSKLQGDLADVVPRLVSAYLDGNALAVDTRADPDRLSAVRTDRETSSVVEVRPCGVWGNDKLAFVSIAASYTGETAIGHMPILLALRKPAAQWQLLVATRDPVTTSRFVKAVPSFAARLITSQEPDAPPAPSTLLSPADGQMPRRPAGQRFGSFTWRSSLSDDVVAEIAEFVYPGDARLFVTRPSRPGSATRLSAGVLWTTHSEWRWRVWSINRSGDVVLTEARRFFH
jgi:hypothetical protein